MPNSNRKKYIWLCAAGAMILVLLAVVLMNLRSAENLSKTMHIELLGDRIMAVEYGQPYREPGAQAVFNGTEPVSFVIEGGVDANLIGTYKIKYIAEKDGVISTAYRVVTVQDTVAPVITLHTCDEINTLPGQPYQEEGFAALDNCDGDLTSQVIKEEENGIVTYTVTDRSGNTATATREIIYYDSQPPVITLNGDTYMVIGVGESFVDPGALATDDVDGDLSDQVSVEGKVDTAVPGVYTLQYFVKDKFGNETSASRTVYVFENYSGSQAKPNGKIIYLTFDDGPSAYTGRLLDVLAKYNVKATFFVVNTGNIEIISRTASEGHTVAIHSATHRFDKIYASDEAFYNDLYTMQSVIERYTGQQSTMLRFPGGSSNNISICYNQGIMTRLTESVQQKGFHYFDWNVDSGDAGNAKTSEAVFENVTKGVSARNTSVVLMHDIFEYSVDTVEQIILWGIANGYAFAPLTSNSPGCHHVIYN